MANNLLEMKFSDIYLTKSEGIPFQEVEKEFADLYLTKSERISSQEKNNINSNSVLSNSDISNRQASEKVLNFCHEGNIVQSIAFINKELSLLNLPPLQNTSSGSIELVCLINVFYELLQIYLKGQKIQQEFQNKYLRIKVDMGHLQTCQNQLKDDLEQSLRNSAVIQEKERQLQVVNKNLQSVLKQQKDEIKKLNCIIEQRNSHHVHELRKKVQEMDKMKERLHLLLSNKTKGKQPAMQILNVLPRLDGKRSMWNTDISIQKQEEKLYKHMFYKYDEQNKILLKENCELRDNLREIYQEILVLTNSNAPLNLFSSNNQQIQEKESIEEEMYNGFLKNNLPKAYFQLPYETINKEIKQTLQERIDHIKQQINNAQSPVDVLSSPETENLQCKEIESLQGKIKDLEKIIQQQEKNIQEMQTAHNVHLSFLNDSNVIEEKEKLAKEKQLFYEQKAHFEQERRNFTDATIRLAKERNNFDIEKTIFSKEQFLQSTPLKYRRASLTDLTFSDKFTPKNSMNTNGIGKTPTTEGLYKFLFSLDDCKRSFHRATDSDSPFTQGSNVMSNNIWNDSCKKNNL